MAKDVARALGYASTNMTTVFQAVPEEWKGMTPVVTPGMALEMLRDAGVAVEVIDN